MNDRPWTYSDFLRLTPALLAILWTYSNDLMTTEIESNHRCKIAQKSRQKNVKFSRSDV